MVHKAKPAVCAMYPLGRCLEITQEIMDRIETADITPQFILNKVECGDNSQEHTVRDWLDSFGIPVREHTASTQINLLDGYAYMETRPEESAAQMPMEIIDQETGEVTKV